jgi:H+/Cl- antiporter ClcA
MLLFLRQLKKKFEKKFERALHSLPLKRLRQRLLSPRLWMRAIVFWGGSICVGITAIFFGIGAEWANHFNQLLLEITPFLMLLIAPLGLGIVAWATRFFVGSQGSGIPQTIAALDNEQLRNRVFSLRIALGKIILTLMGLCCGASIGREGPMVQVGATIMHSLGKLVRFSRLQAEKGLILAGGAAGIAAAFNAPLAGIVFAIEELSRSHVHRTNGTILTGVILAGVTSMSVLGDYPFFGHNSDSLQLDQAWIPVSLCGISGGLLGGLFARALIAVSRGLPGRVGNFARDRPIAFAASCGFVLALLGLFSGGTTFGTGYTEAKHIIEGSQDLPLHYGIFKFLATIVSYASGIPGGVFSPSLAVGAGFGLNLSQFIPSVPIGAVILLSMVGYFAGVVQAPITTFLIVMEMTDNHEMVLPLMATALIATAVSHMICPRPLYSSLAQRFLFYDQPHKNLSKADDDTSNKNN